jgi:hypothetical protein
MQPQFIEESGVAKKKVEYGSTFFRTADSNTALAC